MKILMPVLMFQNADFRLDDGNIRGGLERFQSLVYENIPGIVPVYISYKDRKWTKIKPILEDAAATHNAAAIFWNEAKGYAVTSADLGLPIFLLNHESGTRGLAAQTRYENLQKLADRGGKIYFVSEDAHRKSDIQSKRMTGRSIDFVSGYVPSAFASGDEKVSERVIYDCGTIGRTDKMKDPFWVHRKLKKSSLTSCVITSDAVKEKMQKAYGIPNAHWDDPRFTFRNLTYAQNMDLLAQFGSYVSTCPQESWGITALEALAHGVPLILRVDSSGAHASMDHVDLASDYDIVTGKTTVRDFEGLVRSRLDMSYADRVDLSERTKRKHSKANWIAAVSGMFSGLSQET